MTARKKVKGNQPGTRRKVPGTTKMDSSVSRNTHGQKEGSNTNPVTGPVFASPEDRQRKIEELAYLKAEQRNFASGFEMQDWLEAEKEVDEAERPLPSY